MPRTRHARLADILHASTRRLSLLPALLIAACGHSPTAPNPSGPADLFTARVDGAAWSSAAASSTVVGSANGTFVLTGTTGGAQPLAISLRLFNIPGPGTYPLGTDPTVRGGVGIVTAAPFDWTTPASGVAGEVTISAVSATRITGTFFFTATPLNGSQAVSRTVTQAVVDLPVTASGPIGVPDDIGSSFSGTLDGSRWVAASILPVSAPSTGRFVVVTSNNGQEIDLSLSGVVGVGTYVLNTDEFRAMTAIDVDTGDVWGLVPELSAGSVTITSVSASRIAGRYTATLQPLGIVAAAHTLSGTFDVGLAPRAQPAQNELPFERQAVSIDWRRTSLKHN